MFISRLCFASNTNKILFLTFFKPNWLDGRYLNLTIRGSNTIVHRPKSHVQNVQTCNESQFGSLYTLAFWSVLGEERSRGEKGERGGESMTTFFTALHITITNINISIIDIDR